MNPFTFQRTRLAPTPSGYLHLGNILSFALTAALAAKYGASILLRIDDADRERTNRLYVQDIFDTLSFLEIPWHEGPKDMQAYEQHYSQLHRMDMYRDALQQLRESGKLFACTCSRTDIARLSADSSYAGTCLHKGLPLDAPNVSWRVDTSDIKDIPVKTLDGVIELPLPSSLQYFMVRKRDGFAAYQVTSVVDDQHFGVDLVVRGDDLWPSTLAQLHLASLMRANTYSDTTFYHHPLIMDAAGHKLSKSEGATSVHYLRQAHKSAADIYAMIGEALLIAHPVRNWEDLVASMGIK